MAAPRRSLLLWIIPPVFAFLAAVWSVSNRSPEAPRVPAAGSSTSPRRERPRGERLAPGSAEISGSITSPGGGTGPSGAEIFLAREEWLAEKSPATWRCCEGCSFGLFDEYCDRGAEMLARLDALGEAEVAPSRVTVTRGGRFSFPGLPAGRYAIWGASPRGTLAVARNITIRDRERLEIGLESNHRASLTGVVLSAADGAHAANAAVVAVDPRAGRVHRAAADEQGRFELADLDPDVTYFVGAWADGLAPEGRPAVSPGDELVLELDESGSIGGVVTLNGAPAPDVRVELDEFVEAAATDRQGKFRFDRLAPGIHLVRAATEDGLGRRLEIELPRGLTRRLDLELRRVCTLVARVTDGKGPLAGADVRLFAKGSIDHRVEKTGEDGTASFEMLTLGTYDVEARRADRGRVAASVALGTACSTHTETLRIPESPGVHGRVVDDEERPIAGVEIDVAFATPSSDSSDDATRAAITDERGRFRVPSLGAGSWELKAVHPGYVSSLTSLEMEEPPGEIELEIVLSAGGAIAGRLVDPAQNAVPGWIVYASPSRPVEHRTVSQADGGFRLAGLEPGEYVLTAGPPPSRSRLAIESSETHAAPVRVRTGEEQAVITTRGTGTFAGTVTFAGGDPPESFTVVVPGIGARTFDGPGGRFTVERAIAATYPVLFTARGFSSAVVRVTVERDRRAELALGLHASARLEGRILDGRDGRPVADATVVAVPAGAGEGGSGGDRPTSVTSPAASSRRDGAFELRDLEPGQHYLNVQADGYSRARFGPFELQAGDHAQAIEVHLDRSSARVSGSARRGELALPGAVLTLEVREPHESIGLMEKTRADERGEFSFDAVEPGVHVVTVAARLDGARSGTIVHRRSISVPATGLAGIDLDVADRRERSGRRRLLVDVPPRRTAGAGSLVVTLRAGRIDPDRVAELDGERGEAAEARVLDPVQRLVIFDRLAPGPYTVSLGELDGDDGSVMGCALGTVRTITSRHVEVSARGRDARLLVTAE